MGASCVCRAGVSVWLVARPPNSAAELGFWLCVTDPRTPRFLIVISK